MSIIDRYLAMSRAFIDHLGTDAGAAFEHYMALAQPVLDHYGYLAVFATILVEGFGIPAPGQTMLMAGALTAARGGISIYGVLGLGFLGAVLGNSLGYGLGRWGGRPLLRKLGVKAARMERIENLFERYGGGVVFIGRFLDGLRQLNGIAAGALGMSWYKFSLYNLLGAAVWTGLWGLGTYLFDEDIQTVFAIFHAIEPYLIFVGVLAVVVLALYLWRGRSHD
jgi:membrane protein DedA with SNARE-associated domain